MIVTFINDTYRLQGRVIINFTIEDDAITAMELDDGTQLLWRAWTDNVDDDIEYGLVTEIID